MPAMGVLVVHGDAAVRASIARVLAEAADLPLLGECISGSEAVAAIDALLPDLVLLQVRLPDLSGFEVLDRVPDRHRPLVVFLDASYAAAGQAFDVHALDYLLEPVDEARLRLALDRARSEARQRRADAFLERLSTALGVRDRLRIEATAAARAPDAGTEPAREPDGRSAPAEVPARAGTAPPAPASGSVPPTRVVVRRAGRTFYVAIHDIERIEAVGYYLRLHVGAETFLVRRRMKEIESTLPSGFFRIHRSHIVRLDRVRELQRTPSGEVAVLLLDGTRLPLSRYRRREFEHRLAGT